MVDVVVKDDDFLVGKRHEGQLGLAWWQYRLNINTHHRLSRHMGAAKVAFQGERVSADIKRCIILVLSPLKC